MNDFYSFIDKNDSAGIVRWFHSSIDSLKASGATVGAICSNTPHLYQKEIFEDASLPMVSIVDSAIEYIKSRGYARVLVLGTPITMERGLYDKTYPPVLLLPLCSTFSKRPAIVLCTVRKGMFKSSEILTAEQPGLLFCPVMSRHKKTATWIMYQVAEKSIEDGGTYMIDVIVILCAMS